MCFQFSVVMLILFCRIIVSRGIPPVTGLGVQLKASSCSYIISYNIKPIKLYLHLVVGYSIGDESNICMSSVCHPYAIHMSPVCHLYAIRMSPVCHPYVTGMSSVCHPYAIRMPSVCHPYETRKRFARWSGVFSTKNFVF